MRRAKVMLMTLAVIAVVGTALAFKVAKKGNATYCYLTTTVQPATGGCTAEITSARALPGTTEYFYTRKNAECNTLVCPSQALGWSN